MKKLTKAVVITINVYNINHSDNDYINENLNINGDTLIITRFNAPANRLYKSKNVKTDVTVEYSLLAKESASYRCF